MTMQPEFLPSTGLLFSESEMCELSAPTTSRPLTSSAVASPVRILVTQASGPESPEADPGSGASSLDSLASYDPATHSLRTSQHSLDGDLTPFSATLPRSGTMRNGRLYRRRPLVRRTAENASLLWPTPTVPNGGRSPKGGMSPTGMTPDGKKRQVDLQHTVRMVERRLWPTPKARDWRSGGTDPAKVQERIDRRKGQGSIDLPDAVSLAGQDQYKTGLLNPQWVEWLMGFPIDWTELED